MASTKTRQRGATGWLPSGSAGDLPPRIDTPAPSQVSGTGVVQNGASTTTVTLNISSTGTSASSTCTIVSGGTILQCKTITSYTRTGTTVTFAGTASPATGPAVTFTATAVDGANPNGAGRDSVIFTAGGKTYGGTLTAGNITIN